MKKVLIAVGVIVIVGAVFLFLYVTQKEQENPDTTQNGTTFPVGSDTQTNNSGSTTDDNTNSSITDDNNTDDTVTRAQVNTDAILARKETIDIGSGSYILAGGNDTKITPPYQILYYVPDDSYVISLLSTPVRDVRIEAETEFLSIVKLSKKEACTLKVLVSTPNDVSEKFSGRNLGLSFCMGSEGMFD